MTLSVVGKPHTVCFAIVMIVDFVCRWPFAYDNLIKTRFSRSQFRLSNLIFAVFATMGIG